MGHSVVCLGGKDVHTELRDQFMPTASDILRCGFLWQTTDDDMV